MPPSLPRAPPVDGKLAYSKLATGVFPHWNALAEEIDTYAQTGEAPAKWQAKA